MRVAKHSELSKRIIEQHGYVFNYLEYLWRLSIKKGMKLRAQKLIFMFARELKRIFQRSCNIIFNNIFNKYYPCFSLQKKKIAGTIYNIPCYLSPTRGKILLLRWFLKSVDERSENKYIDKLINEFLDLASGLGKTLKKREDHCTIALANRPYIRFLRKKKRTGVRSRRKKYGLIFHKGHATKYKS